MAEQQTAQERTEQPTERRKKQAREKGQVPRSRELNTMLSLLVAAAGLLLMGRLMATEFASLIGSALDFGRQAAYDKHMIAPRFVGMMLSSLWILTPFFAVLLVGSLVGPLVMGGWSFSMSALAFKLEKLSPLAGAKRVLSAKGLLELLKALFKFIVLSAATAVLFYLLLDQILSLGIHTPLKAFAEAAGILQWGLLILSFTLISIVVFDVPFEIWNHNRQLRMTRVEVQDELKESEGRPEVKNRIRTLQREVSQRRMMEAVPTADVVITNPTHFAVALKYEGAAGSAPIVVAKGRDLVAMRIRGLAADNEVAVFQAPPLARALYASTEIGREIPENLYLAVAQVLAYIYQLRTSGRGDGVAVPTDIPVPAEYRGLYED